MCVVEARAANQIELGGWLYPMIKLSKVRRSLIRRWSMMCLSSEKGGLSLPSSSTCSRQTGPHIAAAGVIIHQFFGIHGKNGKDLRQS
jgi:hypothetical protein